jgi:hypothetical protein
MPISDALSFALTFFLVIVQIRKIGHADAGKEETALEREAARVEA